MQSLCKKESLIALSYDEKFLQVSLIDILTNVKYLLY